MQSDLNQRFIRAFSWGRKKKECWYEEKNKLRCVAHGSRSTKLTIIVAVCNAISPLFSTCHCFCATV